MTSSKLNDWLTLIANLAVVGGIVFLAVEIHQNTELLRSESRQALISNDLTSLTENVAYSDLFVKLASGEELSSEEQMQLSFIFTIDLRNREFEYFQYVNGLLDEETWMSYRQVILINHSSERGRAWWDKVGRGIVDPEFGQLVDDLLENAEPDDTYERMSTWADGTLHAGQDQSFTRPDGTVLSGQQIDATVDRLMQAGNVPGLALALIGGGENSYIKAYGMADIAEGRPLQTDTVMYGASLTKSAFAYMVMTLVDEGAVDLDASISELLPKPLDQYEDYADLAGDERWRQWTMRMLLSHQAGLPNWRWFSESQKLEILFEPGSRYAYSGEGIQIAQMVLEEGLGLDVNALMNERVFDRFSMQRTSMLWREDFRPNFARGYDKDGKNLGHNMRKSVRAAGSMDTTVADYAEFLAGVLRGEGLTEAARDEMLSPQVRVTARHQFPTQFPVDTDANEDIKLSYGLGWGLFESAFGHAFFKEGHDDGTNNYALCLDETKHCILILSNSSNGESIFLYLVDELMGKTGLPWEWEGYVPYDRK